MRRTTMLLAVVFLALAGDAMAQRYAIVLGVDDTVRKNFAPQILNVTQGVLARISGRDPVAPDEPDRFDRYVLSDTAPEIDVRIYVGYTADAAADIVAVLEALPPSITAHTQYGANSITLAEIERLQIITAEQDGASRVWVLRSTTRPDGFINQKFKSIAEGLAGR